MKRIFKRLSIFVVILCVLFNCGWPLVTVDASLVPGGGESLVPGSSVVPDSFSLIDISGFLSHVYDNVVDRQDTTLKWIWNKIINDDVCPVAENSRHSFVYGLTQKDGVSGYYCYCEHCGQFAGDLTTNYRGTGFSGSRINNNRLYKAPDTLCVAIYYTTQRYGEYGYDITYFTIPYNGEYIRTDNAESHYEGNFCTVGDIIYNSNGLIFDVYTVPTPNRYYNFFRLGFMGEDGYMPSNTYCSSVDLIYETRTSNVVGTNVISGDYFDYIYVYNTSYKAVGIGQYVRVVVPYNSIRSLYKNVNVSVDDQYSGSMMTNIESHVAYYDQSNDTYIYGGYSNDIVDFSTSTVNLPGSGSLEFNSYGYDYNNNSLELDLTDGEDLSIQYNDDGFVITRPDGSGGVIRDNYFYITNDLDEPVNTVTAPDNPDLPVVTPGPGTSGSGTISGTIDVDVDVDVNQRPSTTDSYITTHEDIPSGIVQLREKLALMFSAFPDMIGDVGSFLNEGFSFVPNEIKWVIGFGMTCAVFVGIFKLFFR